MQLPAQEIKIFQHKLLKWYKSNKRNLPWRKTRDPYRILLSEIMLQQTQVARVISKYEAWLAALPTIADLARATNAEVLGLWSGLGYNRRALYLKRIAEAIMNEYNGQFPKTYQELTKLPGIGPYTARAVACFAFDEQVAVVDTNIRKVITVLLVAYANRHSGEQSVDGDFRSLIKNIEEADSGQACQEYLLPGSGARMTEKEVSIIAQQLLPSGRAYEWNQALMDYASLMLKEYKIALPKQSRFFGSNRYYRGKIIRLLLTEPQVTLTQLGKQLKADFSVADQVWLENLVEGLVKDQLVRREGATLILQ